MLKNVISILLGSTGGLQLNTGKAVWRKRGKRSLRTKEEMGNKGRRKRRESLLGLIREIIGGQSMQR